MPYHVARRLACWHCGNVYKPGNVIANTLKMALAGRDKLLLTATPLQNSLLELFGLVSFIDEHVFGDTNTIEFLGKQLITVPDYDRCRIPPQPR